MSTPGKHKIFQTFILAYAKPIGYSVVPLAQATQRERDPILNDDDKLDRMAMRVDEGTELRPAPNPIAA
jgi:hypothetical protein